MLCTKEYARAVVDLTDFKGNFDLSIDRTNWKFGKKDINYLVLSWRISKQVALPLMFVELNKAGNSNTQERIDLLGLFDEVFGLHRIKSLMGDREFIGRKWFEMLMNKGIPFCIRVKEDVLLPCGQNRTISAKCVFQHLTRFQTHLVEKGMYGGSVFFAGTRSKTRELVIVMTNRKRSSGQILKKYRQRWSIEELFKKLKSSGFHWENTHMKDSRRLETLLTILSFSVLIASLFGTDDKIPWKKTLFCPLYSVFTQGLHNFKFMLARDLAQTIDKIMELIENAKNLLF